MSKILDTNILLDYNNIVEDENDIIIHKSVLQEIDSLKKCGNKEKEKKAKKASMAIKNNKDKIIFDTSFIFAKSVDMKLLKLAKRTGNTLVTNDTTLSIFCYLENVKCEEYHPAKVDYTGVYRLYTGKDDAYIEEIYQDGVISINLFNNEYIYIIDDNEVKDIFVYRNGECEKISRKTIDQEFSSPVKARNSEQACLLDALFNPNISILYAGGSFGVGKSFLLTSYAINQLQKGKINKIVWIPNNSQVENTRELGILPGEMFEKEIAYMGTLVDIIGLQMVEEYFQTGQLEILPIAIARGRNLENCIVIVNEAENLTENHIKLLIGRVADGTRIFFDGDIKQADSKAFKEKSGLRLLTQLRLSEEFSELFAMIKLETVERSKTARAADYLDTL